MVRTATVVAAAVPEHADQFCFGQWRLCDTVSVNLTGNTTMGQKLEPTLPRRATHSAATNSIIQIHI